MKNSLSYLFTECYLRDNHTCQDCGSLENLEIHHLLPISQGGKNTLDNLRTVCHDCHITNYKNIHYPKDKSKIVSYELREKNRYGLDKSKFTAITISITPDVLDDIKNYWHENRLKNRSEAIRELIKMGLQKEQKE